MSLFKNRKRMVFCSLTIILALMLSSCGASPAAPAQSSEPAADSSSNLFRVGMECAYAPFNWTQTDDANGAIKLDGVSYAGGYDVEIAKLIAQGLGKELVIVKTEWDGLSPSLTSGKIDAIIAGMSATSERKETIDFTDNYYTSDIVVVVRKDSPFAAAKSINDFAGAKITGQLNTLHYGFIDQMAGAVKQTALEDFPTMIVSLSSGKVDGYVSERPGAISATFSNPELTYIEFEEGKGFDFSQDEISIAIGLVKNSPYKDDINKVLAGIDEATRSKIMEDAIKNQPLNQ